MGKGNLKKTLDKLFYPESVAVVGASQNSSSLAFRNLRLIKSFGFTGNLYAVNPRGEDSSGVAGYKSLLDIPQKIDLCIIAVPAPQVVDVVADCAEKGISVAQILSSGFGESGRDGHLLEQAVLRAAKKSTRLAGPNCMGIYSAPGKLTFVTGADERIGKISIASQSGGLGIEMLSTAKSRGLCLNKLISIGNCLDLDPVDFLEYFGEDPDTDVIGFYLEGLRRGSEFANALRKVCPQKPVVILKGGRTALGSQSVASHTNSLAGEQATWQSAVRQAGGMLVESVEELLATLTALQTFVPRPVNENIAFVGNGGGNTVLATDLLVEQGLTLAALSQESQERLSAIKMPSGSTVGNPTDTPINAIHKSGGEVIGQLVKGLAHSPEVGGVILHFNLLPFINYDKPRDIAKSLSRAICSIGKNEKPVYLALYGNPDPEIEEVRRILLDSAYQAGFPCFQSLGEAVKTLTRIYNWQRQKPAGTPLNCPLAGAAVKEAGRLLDSARKRGNKWLSQKDAFRLLELFEIPCAKAVFAESVEEAVEAASAMGYPVVMKIESPDVIHKTDVGGVKVGLNCRESVISAYEDILASVRRKCPEARIDSILVQKMTEKPLQEMICGLKQDAVFGPVVLLGAGGVFVEIMKDASLRTLPLYAGEEESMWRELKIAPLLTGYRGRAKADVNALEDFVRKISTVGFHMPQIAEMDLNPVMVGSETQGVEVVDCRIALRD